MEESPVDRAVTVRERALMKGPSVVLLPDKRSI